ncbi:MAG TPA: DUF4386 family protein [Thermoleophilaceae bacterium]|nr:DUF4386 family protein [Thermoleophilaceae bacterium]
MSTLSDPTRFTRTALGGSMIGSGVLGLAAAVVWPAMKSDDAAQLAVIAQHPSRFYLCTILILASSMLLVPALIGLMRLSAERSPRLTNIGGTLSIFGALVAVGDSMTQLVTWQMVGHGADRAQMAALLHRFDNVAGATLVFSLGGIAIVVGMVLLSLALYRSRAVPAWAVAGLVAGTLVEMVGFMAPSVGVLIVGSVVMLVPLCWIGWRTLASETPAHGFELAPSST